MVERGVFMKYFSLPADFKHETINKYDELNQMYEHSKVTETYGQITVGNDFCSGRADGSLPEVDFIKLRQYVKHSKEKNIQFNYTLNSSYMHNIEFTKRGVSKLKDFLYQLYDCGISDLTITLPTMIELVKSLDIDFNVTASVICQIDSANKALFYKNFGADRIVVSESINRNFRALKDIRSVFGDEIKIIINSICFNECTYRSYHYNQIAGASKMPADTFGMDYYTHRCAMRLCNDLSNFMRLCWIRPEDLHHYDQIGIHFYKLHGRELVLRGNPIRTVESYFREHYDGNLMELLDLFSERYKFKFYIENRELDGYIDKFVQSDFCTHNCSRCHYCDQFAERAINREKAKEILDIAKDFYNKLDPYLNEIKNITGANDNFDI